MNRIGIFAGGVEVPAVLPAVLKGHNRFATFIANRQTVGCRRGGESN
jgi:hypothetical protein